MGESWKDSKHIAIFKSPLRHLNVYSVLLWLLFINLLAKHQVIKYFLPAIQGLESCDWIVWTCFESWFVDTTVHSQAHPYTLTCTHIHTVYIHTHTHTHIHIHTGTYVHTYVHTHTHTYIHVHAYSIHTCTCTHTHTHISYIHTYIHIYIHTHTHIYDLKNF